MPASRPYKHQKSTKNKTQNRRDLIYRTTLVFSLCIAKIEQFVQFLRVLSLFLPIFTAKLYILVKRFYDLWPILSFMHW